VGLLAELGSAATNPAQGLGSLPRWFVALAGGVGGAILGRLWDRREETRRWRRDELLGSLTDAVAGSQDVLQCVANLVRQVPLDDGRHAGLLDKYVAAAQRLSHAINAVGLHDGGTVFVCGEELRDWVNGGLNVLMRDLATFTTAARDQYDRSDWGPLLELDVDPIHVRQ
jgi:hypothetical protein